MQCKRHTFRVLRQDFGGKSKKIGDNLILIDLISAYALVVVAPSDLEFVLVISKLFETNVFNIPIILFYL